MIIMVTVKYGRLYTWEAANKVAAKVRGWHLATDDDWDELCKSLGADYDSDGNCPNIDTKIRQNGPDDFKALLAGSRGSEGNFSGLDISAYFWSTPPNGSKDAVYRVVSKGYNNIDRRKDDSHSNAFSVRLVKD